jgi:hypothetical protein
MRIIVYYVAVSFDGFIEGPNTNTDLYLCGGVAFAGWPLDHELIDTL